MPEELTVINRNYMYGRLNNKQRTGVDMQSFRTIV